MDALTLSTVCLLCTAQAHQQPAGLAQWQGLIAEASARFAIPQSWIASVIMAESGGQTTLDGRPITSSAGAMGLMQVMPKTFLEMQQRYGLDPKPFDPETNILAGTAYLRAMYDRYGYPYLFAAYNVGPSRFDAFVLGHRPLPRATIAYVNRVISGSELAPNATMDGRNGAQNIIRTEEKNPLFFPLEDENQQPNRAQIDPWASRSVFVRLSSPQR